MARGKSQPRNAGVELLAHFDAEDLEFFRQFDGALDESFRELSRTFPPEYYDQLRSGMLTSLMSVIGGGRLRVTLVVDTNIVLGDAFRVARGKPSTTERLLASPFVHLVSPTDIKDEARQHLQSDLPKGASLEVGRAHLEKLLAKLTIISETSRRAFERARKALESRDVKDVPFLAVLIDTEGEGIVSRDREAFDSLEGVHRWELGELANLVTTYESGALALAISAASMEAVSQVASPAVTMVFHALLEAFTVFANIIVGLATGAVDALSKVPGWAWLVLGVVGGAVVIAAILDEGFRDWLLEGLGEVADILIKAAKTIVDAAKSLLGALHDLLAWFWDLLAPALLLAGKGALICGGVLMRRMMLLIDECTKAIPP